MHAQSNLYEIMVYKDCTIKSIKINNSIDFQIFRKLTRAMVRTLTNYFFWLICFFISHTESYRFFYSIILIKMVLSALIRLWWLGFTSYSHDLYNLWKLQLVQNKTYWTWTTSYQDSDIFFCFPFFLQLFSYEKSKKLHARKEYITKSKIAFIATRDTQKYPGITWVVCMTRSYK